MQVGKRLARELPPIFKIKYANGKGQNIYGKHEAWVKKEGQNISNVEIFGYPSYNKLYCCFN